jgi:GNAT superfamily N-acetyltransferase
VAFAIRQAGSDDWPAMREVYAQAGRAAWGHILPAETLAGLSAPARWAPDAGADALVAELDDNIVGFICVRPSEDEDAAPSTGEIGALYVHPSQWGIGVGRALLSAGVECLAAAGAKEVTLWTEQRNFRPLRFYLAAGWTIDGAERTYAVGGTEIRELRHRLLLKNTPRI